MSRQPKQSNTLLNKKAEIRAAAEADLSFFIKLVAPYRVLGSIHEEICNWWMYADSTHQMLLMPRDHQKSALMAYRTCWQITRDPTSTFLYVSATSTLAEKQLYFIKNIMTSKVYQEYWPEMINPTEGKRDKWTNSEICIDHPARRLEGIRDSTIFTAGLTTTVTGQHFSHCVLDDVVVKENAMNKEGRDKVEQYYSLLSSIESAGAKEWIVGTIYHPEDLYNKLMKLERSLYGEQGEVLEKMPLYDVKLYQVEDKGDLSGQYLWPRQQRPDGKWFGFNQNIMAEKKEKYLDKSQFYAQYYNNPNYGSTSSICSTDFQYYDKKFLSYSEGSWTYNGRRLNIFASIDFAFSLNKRADYSAIVVVGVDSENNYYVLDIDRFKTERIKDYFEHILTLHNKWNFRKMRAEVTVGQKAIVKELKESYIKPYGLALSIDEFFPTCKQGTKEERIRAILEPKYDNQQVWHYRGGNCQILEDELKMEFPPHDDVKDALASAIDMAVAPSKIFNWQQKHNVVDAGTRFGGRY